MKVAQRFIFILFLVFSFAAKAQNPVYGELKISGKDTIKGWLVSEKDSVFFGNGEKLILEKRGDTAVSKRIFNYSQRQYYPSKLHVKIEKKAPKYFLEKISNNNKIIAFNEIKPGNWTQFERDYVSGDTLRSTKMTDCLGLFPDGKLFGKVTGKVQPDCNCQFKSVNRKSETTTFTVTNSDSVYLMTFGQRKEYFEKSETHWKYTCDNCDHIFSFVKLGSDKPENVPNLIPSYFVETRDNIAEKKYYYAKGKKWFKQVGFEKAIRTSEQEMRNAIDDYKKQRQKLDILGCGTQYLPDRELNPIFYANKNLVVDDSLDFNFLLKYQTDALQDDTRSLPNNRNLKLFRLRFQDGRLTQVNLVYTNETKELSTQYLQQRQHPFSFLMDKKVGENFMHIQKKSMDNWLVFKREKVDAFSGEVEIKYQENLIELR